MILHLNTDFVSRSVSVCCVVPLFCTKSEIDCRIMRSLAVMRQKKKTKYYIITQKFYFFLCSLFVVSRNIATSRVIIIFELSSLRILIVFVWLLVWTTESFDVELKWCIEPHWIQLNRIVIVIRKTKLICLLELLDYRFHSWYRRPIHARTSIFMAHSHFPSQWKNTHDQ